MCISQGSKSQLPSCVTGNAKTDELFGELFADARRNGREGGPVSPWPKRMKAARRQFLSKVVRKKCLANLADIVDGLPRYRSVVAVRTHLPPDRTMTGMRLILGRRGSSRSRPPSITRRIGWRRGLLNMIAILSFSHMNQKSGFIIPSVSIKESLEGSCVTTRDDVRRTRSPWHPPAITTIFPRFISPRQVLQNRWCSG